MWTFLYRSEFYVTVTVLLPRVWLPCGSPVTSEGIVCLELIRIDLKFINCVNVIHNSWWPSIAFLSIHMHQLTIASLWAFVKIWGIQCEQVFSQIYLDAVVYWCSSYDAKGWYHNLDDVTPIFSHLTTSLRSFSLMKKRSVPKAQKNK